MCISIFISSEIIVYWIKISDLFYTDLKTTKYISTSKLLAEMRFVQQKLRNIFPMIVLQVDKVNACSPGPPADPEQEQPYVQRDVGLRYEDCQSWGLQGPV